MFRDLMRLMKPLSDYKRVVIMPVKNETGHSVDSTILGQVFNVSRRTFLDSGLFHEVNGMTEPYFDEAGSDVVYVVPVLFSVSDKPKVSELTLEYAFDDRSEGIRIASLQVVGRGGDVGLDAAVQSVGTGLSRALLSQVNRNSVSSASDGARRYY